MRVAGHNLYSLRVVAELKKPIPTPTPNNLQPETRNCNPQI